jgi:signal transduction histidine kinase
MSNKTIKILIIEDKKTDYIIVRDMLNETNTDFQLEWADKLQTGMERLNHKGVDLVLMDLSLPDGYGLDALVQLHAKHFKVPIVILTALDDESVARMVIRRGAQDYIVKEQISSDVLHRVIRYAIERKRVEHELEVSRASFHNIVEKSTDGIIIVDNKGIVRFINSTGAIFFGQKKEELIEKSFKITIETDNSSEIDIIRTNWERGIGEMRVAETNWEGESAYLVSIRDITANKELDKLKDEFIGNVSHELRTPLTSVRESVSQVLDGILGKTTSKQRKFLSICLRNTDRLKRILDNLLDISKIEAGKVELSRERIDISNLVKGVISSFIPQAQNKGLELKQNILKEKAEVYADKDKVIEVFNNLISNSLKFTEKGHIEVLILKKDDYIECSVTDTGKGIAKENLPKIFDKFQQFGRLNNVEEKGTGLGLSISKGIVNLHDGDIWVESKLNTFTKFTFTLPAYKNKVKRQKN